MSLKPNTTNLESEEAKTLELLLELSGREYGWFHSGIESWGSNWHVKAKNVALEEIRTRVASMVNLKELETFTNTDIKHDLEAEGTKDKSSTSIKIGYSEGRSEEDKLRWVNENNFLIDISDVNIKPGSDYTKTRKPFGKPRTWEASATMTYTLHIYGKAD
jgi:hypothetical protein